MLDPQDILAVDSWYDPSDDSQITEADDKVEFLNNKIDGPTPILGQPVVGKRPTLERTMGPNQLRCFTYAQISVQHMLVPDNFIFRTLSYEIWMVVQIDADLGVRRLFLLDGETDRLNIFIETDGLLKVSGGVLLTYGAWPTDGKPHVVRVLVKSGSNSSITLDNGTPVVGDAGSNGLSGLFLGADKGTNTAWMLDGRIGDVFTAESELVGNDLAAMWERMERWITGLVPNPASIASVDAWYDPTDNNEITASGGLVEFVDNKIGGSIPILGQTTESKRPDINNGLGPNGLRCFTFDGAAEQFLQVSSNRINRTQPYEIWFGGQITSQLGVVTQYFVDGSIDHNRIRVDADGFLRANAGSTLTFGTWPTDGLPHVVRIVANGASSSITLDDGTPTTGNMGVVDFEGLVIGNNSAVTTPLYGKIGDVFVSDAGLSAGDEADMWKWMERWTKRTPKTDFGRAVGLGISI